MFGLPDKRVDHQYEVPIALTITPLLRPPKKERLPDTIAAQLRALIVSKKIKVDDKLPMERELAESLYVSRVVVKQALRIKTPNCKPRRYGTL